MRLITALLAAVMLLCAASAEVVQPSDDFWYLDEANVLSESTEGEIFFANQRLYDACGAEIVVVAIDSTGSMAIDDYAYTLFNEWEIGGSSYRGMLLLMAIEDDNYYAMPGTNMGSYFDSATLSQMLNTYLEPDFAKKDYDTGARLFFEAVYEKMVDDLNLDLSITDAKADYQSFLQNPVSTQQGTTANVDQPLYDYQPAHYEYKGVNVSVFPVLIIMLIALFIVMRSFRSRPRHVPRSGASSMMTGFILGRMSSRHRRFPGPDPMPGGPRMDRRPPMGGPGGMNRNSRSFGGFSSGGFGGAGRSSGGFGGASRGGGASGGFGGASRSGGGASRGPSTRGGGSGRFSR